MVLGIMLAVLILLLTLIAFSIGFCFGHIKSTKKIVLNVNLFESDEDGGEDGDGESLPSNVTPIRKDAITNDW